MPSHGPDSDGGEKVDHYSLNGRSPEEEYEVSGGAKTGRGQRIYHLQKENTCIFWPGQRDQNDQKKDSRIGRKGKKKTLKPLKEGFFLPSKGTEEGQAALALWKEKGFLVAPDEGRMRWVGEGGGKKKIQLILDKKASLPGSIIRQWRLGEISAGP